MRIVTLVSLFVMFIFTSSAWALEPISEQQATFYYQIPFGGIKKADNNHKFGFRVDRVTIDRATGQYSDPVSFNDLMKRPASLDLQMGHSGIAAFKMHGYDYLPQLISKADEEENGEVIEDGEAGENGEAEEQREGEEEKYLKLPELNQTSFGVLLGIGIAVIATTL